MSRIDIKNISGKTIKFYHLKGGQEGEGMLQDEVILIANDSQLGEETENFVQEAPLNTVQSLIWQGDVQILENGNPFPTSTPEEKRAAIDEFEKEISLVETFVNIPILRANSLETQIVSNTDEGTVVKWSNIRESRKISLDPETGEIASEVNASFSYNISLNLDAVRGWDGKVQTWFETKVGNNWVLYPNSGWSRDFGRMTEGHVMYSGVLNLIQGVKFRMKIRSSKVGAQLLKEEIYSQGQSTDVPSALISIHG